MEIIYLSRRNLQVLLSKLDRKKAGETSACTLIKYKVDIYFAGHCHNLEHLTDSGIEYIISGSGAKKGNTSQIYQTKFDYGGNGYTVHKLINNVLYSYFICSHTNKILYSFKLNKKKGDDANAYILGVLAYKSKQKRISYDSWHALSGKALNRLFRNEYPKHLKSLIENGYIKQYSNPYSYTIKGVEYKSNGTFSIGQSSKRYALNYKKPLFKDYIITDKKLIAKIKKARIERTKRIDTLGVDTVSTITLGASGRPRKLEPLRHCGLYQRT